MEMLPAALEPPAPQAVGLGLLPLRRSVEGVVFGNFWEQFSLNFPFMGADAQGGLFAAFQAPEPAAGIPAGSPPAAHSPTPPGTESASAPTPKPQGAASALGSPLAMQQAPIAPQQQPPPSPLDRRGSFALERPM